MKTVRTCILAEIGSVMISSKDEQVNDVDYDEPILY